MKWMSSKFCWYSWLIILNSCMSKYTFGYINVRLQDYLCADRLLVQLRKVIGGEVSMKLTDNLHSAAIIHQMWNRTLPGFRQSNIYHDCTFRVYSSQQKRLPRGIYSIITHLKFRRDPITNKCVDYIQFRDGNRSPSEQYCNDISPKDGSVEHFIFDERKRDVSIVIHIDKYQKIVEPLELRMVLTAHSECKYPGDFLCDPNDSYSCISRYLVCDNVTNCNYPFRDEISCMYDSVSTIEIDTTNVAISAITSFIFTMLGVVFCVWICWKYWNCITTQQHAYEASAVSNQTNLTNYRDSIQGQDIEAAQTIERPSAPDINDLFTTGRIILPPEEQQSQIDNSIPKDLPPSYESLFPGR